MEIEPTSETVFVFCSMSTRTISVYDSRNLFKALSTVETTVDPSTLIPFYDEDSAVLFLSGKVCIADDVAFNKRNNYQD